MARFPAANRWQNSDEHGEKETVAFSSIPEPHNFNMQKTSWAMVAEIIPQSRKTGNTGGGFPAKNRQPYSVITSLPSVPLLPGLLHTRKEVLWQSTFCFYNPFFFHLPSTKLASFSSSLPNPSLHFCPEIKNAGGKGRKYKTNKTMACHPQLLSLLLLCVLSCLEATGT